MGGANGHFLGGSIEPPETPWLRAWHTQGRLMGNFGLNASPWLKDIEGALCFICKEDIENTDHFLLDCPQFKENFDSIWRNLDLKIMRSNPTNCRFYQGIKSST